MREKLLKFWNGIETVFTELKEGKWLPTELSKITKVAVSVTGAILAVLSNNTVDDILSAILPPSIVALFPTIEADLLKALNAMMGVEAGDTTPLVDTLEAFITWMKNQPGYLQDAICQKVAAILLSFLEGKISVTEAQMYVDAEIHKSEIALMK